MKSWWSPWVILDSILPFLSNDYIMSPNQYPTGRLPSMRYISNMIISSSIKYPRDIIVFYGRIYYDSPHSHPLPHLQNGLGRVALQRSDKFMSFFYLYINVGGLVFAGFDKICLNLVEIFFADWEKMLCLCFCFFPAQLQAGIKRVSTEAGTCTWQVI